MVGRDALRGDGVEAVSEAVRGGVDWVQVRERALADRALLEWIDALCAAARRAADETGRALRIVINRRADAALAAGADGVHLGFDAMAVADARHLLGADALVGVSVHAVEEVRCARDEGASYAHLAPIFEPLSKPATRPPLGLEALARLRDCSIPVLAQGGIEVDNARAAIDAGAAGVAVTGAIAGSDAPRAAARALREALDG